jgi:hypothetical protein
MAAVTVPAEKLREALHAAGFRLLGSPIPVQIDGPDGKPIPTPSDQAEYELSLESVYGAGSEEVWYRHHKADRNLVVKVFSSVRRGAGAARGVGEDAIRVVAIKYKGPEKGWVGIWKGKRVFRTGTVEKVLMRMLARMREAYGQLVIERHPRGPGKGESR